MNPGSSSYVPSKAKTLAEKRAKLQVGVLFIYSWCHENGYFSVLSFNQHYLFNLTLCGNRF